MGGLKIKGGEMKPTQEQVIAWAREAGMMNVELSDALEKMYVAQLQRGFTLAYEAGRKDENEACAIACLETYSGEEAYGDWPTPEMCAAAIRARIEQ